MPGAVSRYEEASEVLQGEVMESIIVEKDMPDYHEAWVFELDGHLYLASMGRRERPGAYMGLLAGASPTVFVAYVHKGKFEVDMSEQVFINEEANSLNHLIYLFEKQNKPRPGHTYYSQDAWGRGYEDFTSTWKGPVGFGAGVRGQSIVVEVDGKMYEVTLGDDTIREK